MLLFNVDNENGPSVLENGVWCDLDNLDRNVIKRLDELEETIREMSQNTNKSLAEIAYRLRMCQLAYYSARSLSLISFYSVAKTLAASGAATSSVADVRFPPNDPVFRHDTKEKIYTDLLINAEAFYYSAFRIVELSRKEYCDLEKIKPMGIIQVRNSMIQHAINSIGYRHSGDAYTLVFGFGEPLENGFIDPGMATNCHEFLDSIESALKK